jgi:gliding motility-associated-like protein
MYNSKLFKLITFTLVLFAGVVSFGQVIGVGTYMIGDLVDVAIDNERGKEGTAEGGGFHYRGGAFGTPCGFVSDPGDTGWDPLLYNGDYFTPGSPENGFGVQINGTDYANNAGGAATNYQIPMDPDHPITHSVVGDCITVEWQGEVDGVTVNVKYHLTTGNLFYTTEVTMINNTEEDLTDVYYYRNVDPDNNQSIGGSFVTTNTIVVQPSGTCQKSLVSAEQFTPHDSYLGFGALGDKFRVAHGGFSNRDADDIWNGTGLLTGVEGDVAVADAAIAIAYKDDIPAGDSINFTYAIVLSGDAVEDAFATLYYIDYETVGGVGGGVINQCNPEVDSVTSCAGNDVLLTVDGPNAGDYEWTWTSTPVDPDLVDDGPTVTVAPNETTTYTVLGEPISECLSESITKSIVVVFSEGPQLEITDPGPFCEDFDLTTLEFEDINDIEGTVWGFYSEMPDSAKQTEPLWPSDFMGPGDEVWLMIGDTANGCFSAQQVIIDFGGLGAAGADSTFRLCGTPGTFLDLHDLIEEGANPLGSFNEVTFSGQFNEATGVLDVGGLAGTYTFEYTVTGVAPCPDDEAIFTVVVDPQPIADFEYEVTIAGETSSSADGLGSTCVINEVDFVNMSTIPAGSIDDYLWDFGDGSPTSALENPSHLFTVVGEYTITLTVTTDEGCTSTFTKDIVIYDEPVIDLIFNEPTCYGFTDGSITVFTDGGSGSFEIIITDEDDNVLNTPGSNTANTLGAGTYYIVMEDASGCNASATITLNQNPPLEAFYRVVEPLCYGDSGYVVVDSVTGENINNPMSYFWAPNPAGISGLGADSSYWMTAGTYTLTVNDSKGCSNVIDITIGEPDSIAVTFGSEAAYCRLYNYQNGNGVVFVSANGGTGNLDYLWTEVATGNTSLNSTWGGRNPGEYVISVTDENGCVVTNAFVLDSLNPIADFEMTSPQFTANYKGTAPMDVNFVNKSLYYDNPNTPTGEPTFFWNLDTIYNSEWTLTYDITEEYDTSYLPKGVSYDVIVCLETFNKNGCSDMKCKIINVFEPIRLDNVNIFTPNGDGANDVFSFVNHQASISTFSCVIVNRWGIKVHEMDSILDEWDGTDMNGSPCQDGVYFYTYEAVSDNGTEIAGQSTVTIQRGKN